MNLPRRPQRRWSGRRREDDGAWRSFEDQRPQRRRSGRRRGDDGAWSSFEDRRPQPRQPQALQYVRREVEHQPQCRANKHTSSGFAPRRARRGREGRPTDATARRGRRGGGGGRRRRRRARGRRRTDLSKKSSARSLVSGSAETTPGAAVLMSASPSARETPSPPGKTRNAPRAFLSGTFTPARPPP